MDEIIDIEEVPFYPAEEIDEIGDTDADLLLDDSGSSDLYAEVVSDPVPFDYSEQLSAISTTLTSIELMLSCILFVILLQFFVPMFKKIAYNFMGVDEVSEK